jgi:hypothetical protein
VRHCSAAARSAPGRWRPGDPDLRLCDGDSASASASAIASAARRIPAPAAGGRPGVGLGRWAAGAVRAVAGRRLAAMANDRRGESQRAAGLGCAAADEDGGKPAAGDGAGGRRRPGVARYVMSLASCSRGIGSTFHTHGRIVADRRTTTIWDDVPVRPRSSFRDEVPGTRNTATFRVPGF